MADAKLAYAASSALTVSGLHSLAASATWVAGWESATIDNTTNLYLDYRITAHLVTHASNRQAGSILIYLFGPVDDSTWPDLMDGTEGTDAFADTYRRDACARLAASINVDNTASAVYDMQVPSVAVVFGGNLPKKFGIFITGNAATSTNAQFAASGSVVTITGSYITVT